MNFVAGAFDDVARISFAHASLNGFSDVLVRVGRCKDPRGSTRNGMTLTIRLFNAGGFVLEYDVENRRAALSIMRHVFPRSDNSTAPRLKDNLPSGICRCFADGPWMELVARIARVPKSVCSGPTLQRLHELHNNGVYMTRLDDEDDGEGHDDVRVDVFLVGKQQESAFYVWKLNAVTNGDLYEKPRELRTDDDVRNLKLRYVNQLFSKEDGGVTSNDDDDSLPMVEYRDRLPNTAAAENKNVRADSQKGRGGTGKAKSKQGAAAATANSDDRPPNGTEKMKRNPQSAIPRKPAPKKMKLDKMKLDDQSTQRMDSDADPVVKAICNKIFYDIDPDFADVLNENYNDIRETMRDKLKNTTSYAKETLGTYRLCMKEEDADGGRECVLSIDDFAHAFLKKINSNEDSSDGASEGANHGANDE